MLRNKNYVLEVYREGSFSRAAEKLYISQPSLSASVKRIEEKVGFPIFDRSASPIKLTEIGKEYVRIALEIEEKERGFERYVADHAKLLRGKIRIGGSSLFSSFVIPRLISEFRQKYPKIDFEIFEDSTKNLVQKLWLGELDIIIDNAIIDEENIGASVYSTETLLLAVPKSYGINEMLVSCRMTAQEIKSDCHLERGKEISIAEFRDAPFVLLNPENDTGKRALAIFKQQDFEPNVIFHLDQQVTAYNVSSSGMGVSFVSDTLVKNIDASPDLYFYKPAGEKMKRNIFFYQKKNYYLSLVCQRFIEYNTK